MPDSPTTGLAPLRLGPTAWARRIYPPLQLLSYPGSLPTRPAQRGGNAFATAVAGHLTSPRCGEVGEQRQELAVPIPLGGANLLCSADGPTEAPLLKGSFGQSENHIAGGRLKYFRNSSSDTDTPKNR